MIDALGYEGWKEVRDYWKRWLVEMAFSAFKRVLGSIPETIRVILSEHLSSSR
jgi:hypothetical protein